MYGLLIAALGVALAPVAKPAFLTVQRNPRHVILTSKPAWDTAVQLQEHLPPNPKVVFLGTATVYGELESVDLDGAMAALQADVQDMTSWLERVSTPGTITVIYHQKDAGGGKLVQLDGQPFTVAEAVAKVNDADVIYVAGGNTYALQHFLQGEADMQPLTAAIMASQAVYVGSSAGAIVAAESAEAANWKNLDCSGDDIWGWQQKANCNVQYKPAELSVYGLAVDNQDRARVSDDNGVSLTGLSMTKLGVYPHVHASNILSFAVGGILSPAPFPVLALPDGFALDTTSTSAREDTAVLVPKCGSGDSLLMALPSAWTASVASGRAVFHSGDGGFELAVGLRGSNGDCHVSAVCACDLAATVTSAVTETCPAGECRAALAPNAVGETTGPVYVQGDNVNATLQAAVSKAADNSWPLSPTHAIVMVTTTADR